MNQTYSNQISKTDDGEIDLKELINSIVRRKFYLLGVSSTTLLLGIIYGIITKPVWQGHFQIVMNNEKPSSFSTPNTIIDLSGLSSNYASSELKTEVKILESPFILKPIYDFVKDEKSKNGKDVSKWNFYKWMKANLDINLEQGTSVLNISYKDKDKDLIIPVISKISSAYQKYSKSEKENNISKYILLLDKQIKEKREKSTQSLTELQKFSIENALGNRDGLPTPMKSKSQDNISLNDKKDFNISGSMTANINNNNNNNYNSFENRYNSQYEELSRLESRLIEKSVSLKPNSIYIKSLKDKIKALKLSLSRPPEILLKYRNLKFQAEQDESILNKLEQSLMNVKIEAAKQNDPWRIISEPTLIDEPISPKKIKLAIISLFAGLFLGVLTSFYLDKKSDKIYTIDNFKKKVKFPLLKTISISQSNSENSIDLLLSNLKNNNNDKISLIPIGEFFDKKYINLFIKQLKEKNEFSNIIVSSELNKAIESSQKILLLAPGSCTNYELDQALENLLLQKSNITGWIFIYP